jgi:hypothetical protein
LLVSTVALPADIVEVPSTPTTVNVTLYAMLHGSEHDAFLGSQHTVRVNVRGLHHDVVGTELSTSISLLREPDLSPVGWATMCALPVYVPIDVDQPGTYRIERSPSTTDRPTPSRSSSPPQNRQGDRVRRPAASIVCVPLTPPGCLGTSRRTNETAGFIRWNRRRGT